VIGRHAAKLAQRRRCTDSPLFIIGATHALLTLVCVPLLFGRARVDVGRAFWINLVIAALLAVAGNVLLVFALHLADLSVLGPINAYKSLISIFFFFMLINEIYTPTGVLGVLLILAGSYWIVERDITQPLRHEFVQFFRERGVQLRFAALALSATEAVFLKKALLLSSPLMTFLLWSILGLPIAAIAAAAMMRGQLWSEIILLKSNWPTYRWLAITTGLMQWAPLYTFAKVQVGYSLALFQLSAVLSVFLGHRYFQEPNVQKRLLGSAIMVLGAVLIVVFSTRALRASSRPVPTLLCWDP
jgi:drug/metabolite transporter (DMT)-like permease